MRLIPQQRVAHIAIVGQLAFVKGQRILHLAAHDAARAKHHVAAQSSLGAHIPSDASKDTSLPWCRKVIDDISKKNP